MINLKSSKHKVYFIDYENIHRFEPSKTEDEKIKVIVFIGVQQNNMALDTIIKLHKLTTNLEFVKMSSQGKNCLDFHLCCKFGEMHTTTPSLVEFIVLSKDKGFDTIIKYYKTLGRLCSRKESFV